MRKILKLNIFLLVEKIVRFLVDCGPQIRIALFTNMRIPKFRSQPTIAFFAAVNHLNGPLRKGRDPFDQNSDRSDRKKRTTSKGGPVFSKLFRLDRTDPLSFGPNFPESMVEWIAPKTLLHWFKRSWFVICGFRSVLCVSLFQVSLLLIVIMIDGSDKHNCEGGF